MNDTVRAQRLVADDADHLGALANPTSIHLAHLDPDVHDPQRRRHSPTTRAHGDVRDDYELEQRCSDSKGAAELSHGGLDGDDEHAAASGPWAAGGGAHARRSSSASYARLDTRSRRSGSFGGARAGGGARRLRFDDGQGGEKDGSVDKRRLRALWWRSAAVNVLFILAWYCFSTLISVYNKWMFSADHYNFPYPLFVTSIHMLVQWCLAALAMSFWKGLWPKTRPKPGDYATKIAPCGMATGLDIGLSNLSLRTITLSFYTMCKSSSLAFVLLFAFLFRLETPSWRLAGIILIITAGVILMVSTETQFDFVGMCQVLSASALGGLRWSLTQMLLHKESMGMANPIATLFWLAPIMGVTLATCSLVFDGWGNVFSHEEFWGTIGRTFSTTAAITFPGVLAFSMNVTEFGLIQRTSVVTLSVAGIFKEVAVIFLSTVVFHDKLTPINISGLCVTIFGISLYNYLKYTQFTEAALHASHGTPQRAGGHGFDSSAEDSYEEGAPMLPTGESRRGLLNGSASRRLSDSSPSAPHHSLGRADDSPRSSADLDAQAAELLGDFNDPVQRVSESDKAHQHDADRIPELDQLLEEDERLRRTEEKASALERELEDGVRQHRQARDAEVGDLLNDNVGGL
ncbi:nucleotide-sugar transporter [Rhodotorula toruloides]|uniref:Nucleotide-sugar transporter n=1 Tax=Rhodotorula toruloides TaxID=5286 RepID=A0A511KR00_RHOTO|nr:nucleotide-sugar transporter [Rhodotorula toruloides]